MKVKKLKKIDKSLEIVDIITAPVSCPTVEYCRAKIDFDKTLVYRHDEFHKVTTYVKKFYILNKHHTGLQ